MFLSALSPNKRTDSPSTPLELRCALGVAARNSAHATRRASTLENLENADAEVNLFLDSVGSTSPATNRTTTGARARLRLVHRTARHSYARAMALATVRFIASLPMWVAQCNRQGCRRYGRT